MILQLKVAWRRGLPQVCPRVPSLLWTCPGMGTLWSLPGMWQGKGDGAGCPRRWRG